MKPAPPVIKSVDIDGSLSSSLCSFHTRRVMQAERDPETTDYLGDAGFGGMLPGVLQVNSIPNCGLSCALFDCAGSGSKYSEPAVPKGSVPVFSRRPDQ